MTPVDYLDAAVRRVESVCAVFDEPFVRWDVLARADANCAELVDRVVEDDRCEIDPIVDRLQAVVRRCDAVRAAWSAQEPDDLVGRRHAVALLSLHGLEMYGPEPVDIDVYVPPFAADAAGFTSWQRSAFRGERPGLSQRLARCDTDEWERRVLDVMWRTSEETVTLIVTDWQRALAGDSPTTGVLAALLARAGTASPERRPGIAVAQVPLLAGKWAALAGLVSSRWTAVVANGLDSDARAGLFELLAHPSGVGALEAKHHLILAEVAEVSGRILVTDE